MICRFSRVCSSTKDTFNQGKGQLSQLLPCRVATTWWRGWHHLESTHVSRQPPWWRLGTARRRGWKRCPLCRQVQQLPPISTLPHRIAATGCPNQNFKKTCSTKQGYICPTLSITEKEKSLLCMRTFLGRSSRHHCHSSQSECSAWMRNC